MCCCWIHLIYTENRARQTWSNDHMWAVWHWHVRATRSNHTITFCTTCLPIAHQHQGLQPHPFKCGSPMAPVLLSINMR